MTATSSTETLSTKTVDHIAIVTLDAPERRNALSAETMLAMTKVFRR